MSHDDWDDTFREFRRIAASEGVRAVAREVPVDPSNVYKMIRGEIKHPTHAVRAGIERVVQQREEQTDESE